MAATAEQQALVIEESYKYQLQPQASNINFGTKGFIIFTTKSYTFEEDEDNLWVAACSIGKKRL